MTPEEAVRGYFAAYSDGQPDRFADLVSPDYLDYGHTPPGRGPQGARDDYEHAMRLTGGVSTYDIDALVGGDGSVAVAWTEHMQDGKEFRGLSLYQVADGKITETRHTTIGALPS